MNKLSNLNYKYGGIVFEVEYDKPRQYTRTFFMTASAISRHTDRDNLKLCLSSKGSFTRDACIFVGHDKMSSTVNNNILRNLDTTTIVAKRAIKLIEELLEKTAIVSTENLAKG